MDLLVTWRITNKVTDRKVTVWQRTAFYVTVKRHNQLGNKHY